MPMPTALHLENCLDVLSNTPSAVFLSAPCIHRHRKVLINALCEKHGNLFVWKLMKQYGTVEKTVL